MKRLLLSILFVAFGMFAVAQTQLADSQSQGVMVSLTEATTSMKTLQCRFVQQKTSSMLAEPTVSDGVMIYAAPDKMRWEYTSPYPFALVVNGEQITRIADGKAEPLEGNAGRMYQGIVGIIMGSASGKNLFDPTVFDVKLFDDNGFWKAEMTPKRRDMKRMFSQLVFRFDKKTSTISQVEMVETGGDRTTITFGEIRLNEAIEEGKFQ